MKKTSILMVCLGNICRSPVAEGVLRSMLPAEEFEIDSAGTGGHHTGESPDERSQQVARNNGVEISHLRARKIKATDLQAFDYIFVMDKNNYQDVHSLCSSSNEFEKIHFLRDGLSQKKGLELSDPYYGTKKDFEKMYQQIQEACLQIVKELKK